ncbi:hypothetical protein LINGRAHAP2_LOCUS10128 [Linum grandiflorum]
MFKLPKKSDSANLLFPYTPSPKPHPIKLRPGRLSEHYRRAAPIHAASLNMEQISPSSGVDTSKASSSPRIQVRLVTADPPLQGEDEATAVEDVGVTIEGLSLEHDAHEYEMCIAGLLMTTHNTNLNIMEDRLAMLWRPGDCMVVEDLGYIHYLFHFNHCHDLRWVIDNRPSTFDNRPSTFDNALLILHELKKGETPTSILLTSSPLWIQIHALPSSFSTEQVES